ncbi:MAG: hypothetical protein PHE33_02720 [Bacteroidales bacterium]|nr:hypothetical protein [Bacteroidales bacterium]
MKKIFTVFIIFLSMLIVLGGCASKRYTKKATKLEAMGQYANAADLYYQAIVIKNTNVEAFAGLKRTGQMSLSKKLSEFNKSYNNQNNKEAVYLYEDARNYYNKISGVGIDLNFPTFYNEYYEEVKNIFLENQYYEGSTLLTEEKFAQAENVFKEIVRIQPNYKDSKDKLITATYEPKYRDGLQKMDIGKYRQAYYTFDDIIKGAGAYKSSYDLKAESLNKGTITITIEKIKNLSGTTNIETNLESKVITEIQSFNNPFIKIIDSNNQNRVASSQNNSNSIAATDLSLYCEISKFTYNKGTVETIEKKGYLRKKVKVLNRESEEYEYKNEYSKVKYNEYKMSRTLDMNFMYKLVDKRTGEIKATTSKQVLVRDDIHYAKYTGDNKNLVPGYWKYLILSSEEDYINDRSSEINKLNSLLTARSQIKDYNTLSIEAINETAGIISNGVNKFVNEN